MQEQWKPIKGYEDLYLISNYGKIYSIRRKKEIKLFIDKDGYSRATLHNKMKQKNILVHRVVGETFIPNPNNYPLVLHKKAVIDGGTNKASNLYWGTPLQNMQDKIKDGHNYYSFGKHKGLSKKINQYDLQHNFIRQWDCIADASRGLNIHREQISRVCRKCPKRKSTHNFIFEYVKE